MNAVDKLIDLEIEPSKEVRVQDSSAGHRILDSSHPRGRLDDDHELLNLDEDDNHSHEPSPNSESKTDKVAQTAHNHAPFGALGLNQDHSSQQVKHQQDV